MVIFGIDGAGFMVIFGSFVNFFVNIEVLAGCFFFFFRKIQLVWVLYSSNNGIVNNVSMFC